MEPIQEIAIALLRNGFFPLRLDPDTKAARHEGWTTEVPTEEKLMREFARPANLGVRTGDQHADGTVLLAIDVDVDDAEVIRCVEKAIGVPVPVKRGRKGCTYFVRLDREHKTTKVNLVRDGKRTAAIDILCKNAQTVLPPSIHPETKMPYRWISGEPLQNVDYRTLPVFGQSLIDEIRGFLKNPDDPIFALNDMIWNGVGGGGNTHDTCLVAVSSMVARKWTDEDIHERIQRAKREAVEAAGQSYDWPDSRKVIQEWITSSREKKFDVTSKLKVDDIPMEIINRYVYVVGLDRMYDVNKGLLLDASRFNNLHSRDILKPWQAVLLHPDFRFVDKLTYAPGKGMFCKEQSFDSEAMLDCLNVYQRPDIEPGVGDVTPFITLVKDVFDNVPEAYNHVFSFFAYAVQNPGERINHALVIQGEQGIGKDSIIAAMNRVFGQMNCSQVTLQHVESAFNEWLFGKQLIVFQEMLATGRRGIYNKLKTYITDPVHTVNTKHVSLQRVWNRAVYVFLTNYRHALSIDPGDRRMWVWHSTMTPKPKEYFNKFYEWLNGPGSIAALTQWLLDYDTSEFHPTAPPPMTDAKRLLIEASSSEVEQFLRQAVENKSWPMACDIVSVPHIMGAIRPVMRCSTSMLNEALDNILGHQGSHIVARPSFNGSKLRLRATRDWEKYKGMTGAQLAAIYRMPLPPQGGETEGLYTSYTPDGVDDDRSENVDGPDF